MNPVPALAALIAGLWFGWRWGREALVEEIGEMSPPSFAEIQASLAREGLQ